MHGRRLLGKFGERQAVKHLKKNGYAIVECNYRNKIGEIDIIARDRETIVFIEVKTRRNRLYGSPKSAVHASKQKKIATTAQVWLKQKKLLHKQARFDVVAVQMMARPSGNVNNVSPGRRLFFWCLHFFGKNKKTVHIEIVKNAFQLN